MLFQNIEQFKEYSTFQKNMSFQTLSDSIKEAEERFLLPLIDTPQYLDLLRLVDPAHEDLPTTFDEAEFTAQVRSLTLLLKKARRVVARATMYLVYPHINVTAGDMGVQQNKAANDTSTPSSQWSYNDSRLSYRDGIETSSESLLILLQDYKENYPKWVNSKAFSQYNSLFVRNNEELGKFLNTKDSIRAYIAFRPFLQLAEEKYITPIIPKDRLVFLKYALKNGTHIPEVEFDIWQIQRVMAWYALYEGLPFLNIRMDGTTINIAAMAKTSDKDKIVLINAAKENALLFYTELKAKYEPPQDLSIPPSTTFDNRTKPDFWV
jgi:hypothetical protein